MGTFSWSSDKGWKFLAEEAGKPEHGGNEQVAMMRECLEFFLVVEEVFPEDTQSLKRKAGELEEIVLCLR